MRTPLTSNHRSDIKQSQSQGMSQETKKEEHTSKLQILSFLKSFTKNNNQLLLTSFEDNNKSDKQVTIS